MAVSTPPADLGSPIPSFTLPAVDGRTLSNDDFAKSQALLVVFTCNHCPYAQAVEDRIINLAHAFATEDLQVVAICSNDAAEYPDDAFPKLRERWERKKMPFPYLHDESQQVARAFGAVCTPDFFLYESGRHLAYRGRLDDNWKESSKVTRHELREAIELVLQGKVPSTQNPSMGCSIKWKD
jgi:peroxiredoxin